VNGYSHVRSAWHVRPAPQSAAVTHSTQARLALWQIGIAMGQSALLPQVTEQAWLDEHDGVAAGQSEFERQSTQV
jgi:hypothetical protein